MGPIKGGSWKLSSKGQGAHLLEKVNLKGRNDLSDFNKSGTPRFYPYGTPENAGQAHLRLHAATKRAGIRLQGGNTGLSDYELITGYRNAYSDPALNGILGELRTPNGSAFIGGNLTPAQALEELLKWGGKQ